MFIGCLNGFALSNAWRVDADDDVVVDGNDITVSDLLARLIASV